MSAAPGGFWFWAYSLGPAKPSQAGRTGLLALEDLVAQPDRLAGETVKVVGQFRGKNLFGDLDGADEPGDGWVIKDGAFAVWVVGKKPKGSGWSLDPTSRGDTVRWVQVTGTLDRKGKVTRIKAMEVALVPPPPAASFALKDRGLRPSSARSPSRGRSGSRRPRRGGWRSASPWRCAPRRSSPAPPRP